MKKSSRKQKGFTVSGLALFLTIGLVNVGGSVAVKAETTTQTSAPVNVNLPAAAENKPSVQARVMTTDAPGGGDVNAASGSTAPAVKSTYLDFTGNGRTDWTTLAIPTTGSIRWKTIGNPAPAGANQAFIRIFDYGLSNIVTNANGNPVQTGDMVVPQDYTGDKKTEVAVWRPGSQSLFYVSQFPTGTGGITLERAVPLGVTGDNPIAVGDYDGDGKVDYAVSRLNSSGTLTYYYISSSTNTGRQVNFGLPSTARFYIVTNGADFNGDGRDELVFIALDANFIPTWYAGDAITGVDVFTRQFGDFNTDFLITPADYTGDKKADLVAVRQATGNQIWYINNSATNVTSATRFGISDTNVRGDLQVRGDYDGDGINDIAVWRGSNQTFYYIGSANGNLNGQRWGDPGDRPLANFGIF